MDTSKNDKITSCLASDGQHAPRTHKHCGPCGIHAHDTRVRARTCFARLVLSATFKPTRYQTSEQRVETTQVTVPVETSPTTKITSCLASDGQHAPRTRQHCRPCGMHAHDTRVRAHTCLHGWFSVEHSYQPGTFQCTSSCNNTLR